MGKNRAISDPADMSLVILVIVFLLILLLPFIPGLIELIRQDDAEPLLINMDYVKDPRYFGHSFKKIIRQALVSFLGAREEARVGAREGKGEEARAGEGGGVRESGEELVERLSEDGGIMNSLISLKLSKEEQVKIAGFETIKKGEEPEYILYVTKDFVSEPLVVLPKEVYVIGESYIGEQNLLRAIYGEGGIRISPGTRVIRWADSEKDIDIAEGCYLGQSVTCDGKLSIARGCLFHRLYGNPIQTCNPNPNLFSPTQTGSIDQTNKALPRNIASQELGTNTRELVKIFPDGYVIKANSIIEEDIIARGSMVIEKNCLINGSLKTYSDLVIEMGTRINGHVFGEANITIYSQVHILGNVFTQGSIVINDGVNIGSPDLIKSVIGKKGITLGKGVIIYGYIMTEGQGIIV